MSFKVEWSRERIERAALHPGALVTTSGAGRALYVVAMPMAHEPEPRLVRLCALSGAPAADLQIVALDTVEGPLLGLAGDYVICPGRDGPLGDLAIDIFTTPRHGDLVQTAAGGSYLFLAAGEGGPLWFDLDNFGLHRTPQLASEAANARCFRVWTLFRERPGGRVALTTTAD